jgi:homoserine trans-succinylase
MNMHALVLDLTTDIYFHLNCSNVSENDKFLYLLDDLNYRYIYDTKWEIVPKELVVLNIIAKRCETETNLEKLITTLNLQLE